MTAPREIAEQIAACPTPSYHKTHRYCLSCPWTETPAGNSIPTLETVRAKLERHGSLFASDEVAVLNRALIEAEEELKCERTVRIMLHVGSEEIELLRFQVPLTSDKPWDWTHRETRRDGDAFAPPTSDAAQADDPADRLGSGEGGDG